MPATWVCLRVSGHVLVYGGVGLSGEWVFVVSFCVCARVCMHVCTCGGRQHLRICGHAHTITHFWPAHAHTHVSGVCSPRHTHARAHKQTCLACLQQPPPPPPLPPPTTTPLPRPLCKHGTQLLTFLACALQPPPPPLHPRALLHPQAAASPSPGLARAMHLRAGVCCWGRERALASFGGFSCV